MIFTRFDTFGGMNKINILVICTGNSCRSQMAEAYLRYYALQKKVNCSVHSAGIEAHGINPKVVELLTRDNIDTSKHTSNTIDEYDHIEFSHVITVCDHANENCPIFPINANKTHKNFYDPTKHEGSEKEINIAFQKARAEIKEFCEKFMTRLKNEY